MGCWNGTCQASGLSINHGKRIVVIPIIMVNNEWKMCWYPIRGHYNDYGSIEKVDENFITNKITEKFLNEINKENGNIRLGSKFDQRFDAHPKNIEEIIDVLERERCVGDIVKVISNFRGNVSITFCMILEEVYDWMVKNHNKCIDSWVKKHNNQRISSFKRAVKASTKMLDANASSKKAGEHYASLFRLGDDYNILDRGENYSSYVGGLGFPIGTVKSENVDEYIKIMVDFKKFITVFNALRLPLTPPAMAGSQDDNHEFRLRFNNKVNSLVRSIRTQCEEEE